jgi:hypothetical protein
MTFDLTIAGVPKELLAGTFSLKETANRRCTASFEIKSEDRSYRPAEGAEVIIEEDGTRIFGGLIDRPNESALAGCKRPGITTFVNTVDFTVYAERRFFNGTLAAGTLKSQLTTLVPLLTGYGVTLDAGQVNGPSLPDLTYDYRRLDQVLNELMTLTADAGQPFIWEISYDKKLSAYQPSTDAAPFNLVGNNLAEVIGDIEVETSRSDQYANRIILKVAPKSQIEREETFVGGVDAYPYVPQYTVLKTWGYVTHQTIFETLRIPPDPDTASWTFDYTTGELTRDAGTPAGGDITIFKFDGEFAGVWISEDAGEISSVGIWEKVLVLDSIPNDTTGQAFADAELAKRIAAIKTVKYRTWEQGLTIGQQQTINVSARNVNGSAVIVDILRRDLVHRLEVSVTAIIDSTQTNLGRSFQDDYEIWYGDKAGDTAPATTIGTGFTGGGGPAPPNTSVQFNRAGSFGGDESFTYNRETNSVVCGALSSITAVEHESCQVFGYDGHISDP